VIALHQHEAVEVARETVRVFTDALDGHVSSVGCRLTARDHARCRAAIRGARQNARIVIGITERKSDYAFRFLRVEMADAR
jgi:hypothetical protein